MRNERMCLRKRVFWSEFSAQSRATRINARGVKGGGLMRSYHCPNCLQWHLTSRSP